MGQAPGWKERLSIRTGPGLAAIGLVTAVVYAPLGRQAPLSLDARGLLAVFDARLTPLAAATQSLDTLLFGTRSGPALLENVALHLLASALLFAALRRLTLSSGLALFVAGLHALHPLHVESVAWLAQRQLLLGAVFFALSLWSYARWCETPSAVRRGWLGASLALGLVSSPLLVTLPVVLLLVDVWPLGRLARGELGARIAEKWALFALAGVAAVLALWLGPSPGGLDPGAIPPLGVRIANAALAITATLRQSFVPTDLAVFYPLRAALLEDGALHAPALLAGLALAIAAAGAAANARRHPYLLVGGLWFVVMLVPVLGFVPIGASAHADRFTPLPHVGLFLALGAAAGAVGRRWPPIGHALPLLGAISIGACAVLASAQVGHWRDARALFAHALDAAGPSAFAHRQLALAYANADDWERASGHHASAALLDPRDAQHHYELGIALAALGREAEAALAYRNALARDAAHIEANTNLANQLLRSGAAEEAVLHYRRGLEANPEAIEARNGLGQALAAQGHLDAGIVQLERAALLDPGDARLHTNLGGMLAMAGRLDDATLALEQAVALDPGLGHARFNLAAVLARSGERAAALRELDELERREPGRDDAARLRALLEAAAN